MLLGFRLLRLRLATNNGDGPLRERFGAGFLVGKRMKQQKILGVLWVSEGLLSYPLLNWFVFLKQHLQRCFGIMNRCIFWSILVWKLLRVKAQWNVSGYPLLLRNSGFRFRWRQLKCDGTYYILIPIHKLIP